MEFLPRAMIVGAFVVPKELQLGDQVPAEKYTRIFTEVASAGLDYGQFALLPDGAGVHIRGRRLEDSISVNPPLVQVQSSLVDTNAEGGATRAQTILRAAASVLGVSEMQNLGIKVVYTVPLVTNDAKEFILHRVLSRGGEHQEDLSMGGDMWGGVKYVVTSDSGDATYTVQVEPSVADEMKSLYVDVDAQFPGLHKPGDIETKAAEVRSFVQGPLNGYLDKLTQPS
ncbi:MAG: hypothetical protein M3417_15815 [Actinomycetota bacterium]|nr:hypothetical protein [Actinomycetota bacterium]